MWCTLTCLKPENSTVNLEATVAFMNDNNSAGVDRVSMDATPHLFSVRKSPVSKDKLGTSFKIRSKNYYRKSR